MSDKIKWSIAGVVMILILNNEILSWMILSAIVSTAVWPIVKAGVCLD